MPGCPPTDQLERVLDDSCTADERAAVEQHRTRCPSCDAWLREASADELLLTDLRSALEGERLGPGDAAARCPGDAAAQSPGDAAARTPIPGLVRYRVVRRLGEGGMGIVYEAEQRNPARSVALKIIRPGFVTEGMLRRFAHEAQVLGRLEHPGIARIYEADTFESPSGQQPFFAMELVRGLPLLRYSDRRALGVRERLELFALVCDAVEHAHQKGVLHRDLKPQNVLVTDAGRPKVLDFGVARTADADIQAGTIHTEVGQLIGTLSYMSPEQMSGIPLGVDTRSDVYTLGVILFELLAGRRPHDLSGRSMPEAARVIVEHDAPRLGTVDRGLRGDLETIAAKALAREATRRYASAGALAEDVRRYLRHEPIEARPPSTLYQLRKFARRNLVLASALALVFVALAVGIAVAAAGQARAETQARRAETQARRASAVSDFLQEVLLLASPEQSESGEPTVRDAVRLAASRMDRHLPDDPEVEALIRHTIGRVQKSLGDLDRAEANLQRALALFERAQGENPDVAYVLRSLGGLALARGQWARAERLTRRSLAIGRRLGQSPLARAGNLNTLGLALYMLERLEEAEEMLRSSLALSRSVGEDGRATAATTLSNIGLVQAERGHYQEAIATYREALAEQRETMGEENPYVAATLSKLGTWYYRMAKYEDAERLFRDALGKRIARLGEDHADVAKTRYNLGSTLAARGAYQEAAEHLRSALEVFERRLGQQHARSQRSSEKLSEVLIELGELDRAEQRLRELLDVRRRAQGDDHPATAETRHGLAKVLLQQGRNAAAEPLFAAAAATLAVRHQTLRAEHGADDERTRRAAAAAAAVYESWGRPEEAARYRRAAAGGAREADGASGGGGHAGDARREHWQR